MNKPEQMNELVREFNESKKKETKSSALYDILLKSIEEEAKKGKTSTRCEYVNTIAYYVIAALESDGFKVLVHNTTGQSVHFDVRWGE